MPLEQASAPRCNIGPDEVARRRRSAIMASAIFVALVAATIAIDVPPLGRLLLWPLAAAVGVTWLQVVNRFCVAFGALGLENFGRLGAQATVDPALRDADRRRALQLIVEGGAIGLALTLAVIPLRL